MTLHTKLRQVLRDFTFFFRLFIYMYHSCSCSSKIYGSKVIIYKRLMLSSP